MQGHFKLALISRFRWVGYADTGNNNIINENKNGKKNQFD